MTDEPGRGAPDHELPAFDLDEAWAEYGRRYPGRADLRAIIETTIRREITEAEARREARFKSSAEEILASIRASDAARRQGQSPPPADQPLSSHGAKQSFPEPERIGKTNGVFPDAD